MNASNGQAVLALFRAFPEHDRVRIPLDTEEPFIQNYGWLEIDGVLVFPDQSRPGINWVVENFPVKSARQFRAEQVYLVKEGTMIAYHLGSPLFIIPIGDYSWRRLED